ncbi:MAG TPA: Hsp20 family protein [Stellaceae bacterium]|nr:Hsp20 family protein [Stellaceae bacterium]
MSTLFDFAPLWRSAIGFDHLFDMLEQAMKSEDPVQYPPYNIERTKEGAYRLTLAVAGWRPDEITVTAEPNALVVSGEKAEPKGVYYLYRGIPAAAFERRFHLADYVQVREARIANGLLTIDLVHEAPEALKPRRIPIVNGSAPQAIEPKQAA